MKIKRKLKPMAPIQAVGNHQWICSLVRDNFSTEDAWILLDGGKITLANQQIGKSATEMISINARDFNALVRWYLRKQARSKTATRYQRKRI